MDQWRAYELRNALSAERVLSYIEYTEGTAVLVIELDETTFLAIEEDDNGFRWQHLDWDAGELPGDSPARPGESGRLSSCTDVGDAAREIRTLIGQRDWSPTYLR
jgi:hypothetical protein